jgi:hypothetical protein
MIDHNEVLFVRLDAQKAEKITEALKALYVIGWRVVSHTESADEYSFVLEREHGKS